MDTLDPSLSPSSNSPDWIKSIWKRNVLPLIADLRLAIILLLVIALLSIAGTVIEQGQAPEFYLVNYPESPALFGFLTGKRLLAWGLDHVYQAWWYLAILVLFGASLIACTFTRQFPALRAARRWKYYDQPRQFQKLALSTELVNVSLPELAEILRTKGYKIFQADVGEGRIYARKGLVGRIGPIIVHASMILILLGGIVGSLTGFMAQELILSGNSFNITHLIQAGPFSHAPQDWSVRVNRFWIDYDAAGEIDQFYSDLSVLDQAGIEVKRDTIHVNQPLKYQGVTLYQADWSIGGVRFRINNSPVLQLPMAQLDTGGQGRLWGTWIPTKTDLTAGISLIARDLQGTLLVYDTNGQFLATLRPGVSQEINGVRLTIEEVLGSTGLQIKSDPGIPLFYLGFALLMAGVIMSYVSHSQIWGLVQGQTLYFGGRTNRAQITFEQELCQVVECLQARSITCPNNAASKQG